MIMKYSAWLSGTLTLLLCCSASHVSAAVPLQGGYGLGASLELRDKPAPGLWLVLRYHLVPAGHGRLTDQGILPLGEIRLPGQATGGASLVSSDAVSQTYRLSGKDAAAITVSRLTPAILIELEGKSICLFAGDKTAGWTHPLYLSDWKRRVPVDLPRAPRHYATSDGRSVRSGMLAAEATSLTGAEQGWLLLWFGRESWFYGGSALMPPTKIVPGDAPMLLVATQAPTVKLTGLEGTGPDGSLEVSFAQPGAKLMLLPLEGYRFPAAADTQSWLSALPEDVRKRCDRWAGILGQWPAGVVESVSYDTATDAATLTAVFTHKAIRPGARPYAPLPPMLELARQEGFPINLSGTATDTDLVTYCGPYAVVNETDRYTASIPGLGKYAREALRVQPASAPSAEAEAVRSELVAEVDKILAAGHLAPVNLPWKVSYGWGAFYYSTVRHLYSAPGQTLSTLARTIPWLDSDRRQRVRSYLEKERKEYPPEKVAHLPSGVGARREAWRLTETFLKKETDKFRDQNFHVRTQTVPVQSLYDLACYYEAVGADRMAAEGFDLGGAVNATVEPWWEREEWSTLGWHSWPINQRDPQYYGSYGWNQPMDVNRQAVALIGLARLARAAKDPAWEERAMGRLARVLAYRYAIGRYAAWLYNRGGVLPVPEGFSPADDPRAVTVSEARAVLGYGRNQEGPLPYFNDEEGPYIAMSRELARFFADYLKPQAEAFARATATYYPDAFLTLGTPRRCAEWWHNYPQDPHQIFLVNAWILGQNGPWLQRRLDVPLVPVGDLYHIDKLVATLAAYGQTTWEK